MGPMEIPFHDPDALATFCAPFLRGDERPSTALALMASRYVAYTQAEIDYLVETHDPATRHEIDRKSTEDWARKATWRSLEIVRSERGGPDDDTGEVEFIAHYVLDGVEHAHHERSEFQKTDGRWYFVTGEPVTAQPVRRASPKVGRNDPCPCGSGKKHKKCCGTAA
jgi:SEC-C motif domain protein